MKKNQVFNKKMLVIISVLVITISALPTINVLADELDTKNEKIDFNYDFSKPKITEENDYLQIEIIETNTYTTIDNAPKIPVYTKTFELPIGSKIVDISFTISDIRKIKIDKEIQRVKIQSNSYNFKNDKNIDFLDNVDFFPNSWYDYDIGRGINKEGENTVFFTAKIFPVRFDTNNNELNYISNIKLEIEYKYENTEKRNSFPSNIYDLLVIAPSEYEAYLQPFIEHKENYNIKTKLTTMDEIIGQYQGRDDAEQIKYFVKYALDNWGIKYVLLFGDVYKIPIRSVQSHLWPHHEGDVLSDLYYADIYDENNSFCSWDSNDNDTFGEVKYNQGMRSFNSENIDDVDLYPDVIIGRIPCSNHEEVEIMVDKIIKYEKTTYDQIWFKKIILAGGDTFPPSKFSLPFIYEGEITNKKVAQQVPDFEHITLWATKRNLNFITFQHAINKGAGFLTYAGHGFEMGWGTYRPNALRKKLGLTQPFYSMAFIKYLRNENRLPIMFFDACLTAKLDFTFKDMIKYKSYKFLEPLKFLPNINLDTPLPVIAWAFVKHENGGAIASIGATRSAYTMVDKDGVYAGAGYLDVHFFKAYEEGKTLGEMFKESQVDYINKHPGDFFTSEEFILIGDPTLMVGGYPL